MKAWHLFQGDPTEGSLLVFAESSGKARSMGTQKGDYDWEFTRISAHRAKEWDGLFSTPSTVYDNDCLPAGAKPFYDDSIDD